MTVRSFDDGLAAGVDGTLKDRMQLTAAYNLVRAKTGTLKGAYQIAGYIPRLADDGSIAEYVPFVILSTTTPENETATRNFQDQLIDKLTERVNNGKIVRPQPNRGRLN